MCICTLVRMRSRLCVCICTPTLRTHVHAFSFARVHACLGVLVRGRAWACMGVRGCAWVCMGVRGRAWACVGAPGWKPLQTTRVMVGTCGLCSLSRLPRSKIKHTCPPPKDAPPTKREAWDNTGMGPCGGGGTKLSICPPPPGEQ